uniref:Uncharacterized protein n=1 Tax=Sinocyclocheilus anshuiensis TaxID=1608454 RepID=A0A671PJZ0_9TELE
YLIIIIVTVACYSILNCIGQNEMNEMKVAVALTLKKYRLIKDPQHTPKMIPQVMLRSLNGIHIMIKPVENES